ncbi:F-box/FBD/LRR-repeat protein-like protein [Tanacetum coccineum]
MELDHGAHKASKYEAEDFISSMPDNVITNILDRLPTDDAVRTDILSRDWRFKWTLLTQLVFDEKFFNLSLESDGKVYYNRGNLSRFLLNLKGPISKFVLYIHDKVLNVEDIGLWVLFLSTKGIKDLTLLYNSVGSLKLPTQLYSCMKLEHLKLHKCVFRHSPSFRGFPNLLSLDLSFVTFQSCTIGEFITQCPLVESLRITTNTLKLIEIARIENLKTLYMPLGALNKVTVINSSDIFQLTCLKKLQKLALSLHLCKWAEAGAIKKVPTGTFLCLKTLALSRVNFNDGGMVSFVFEMIRGSPNLCTLKIKSQDQGYVSPWALSDSSTVGQLWLQSVALYSFRGTENEVRLIMFILACSPLLKKIDIQYSPSETDSKISWELATKLLKLHRASPIAEINFF